MTRSVTDSIETARFLAVLMLVGYHVIGVGIEGGLRLPDNHPLRLTGDFLADLRMPLFSCISGFLFGLKPVRPLDLPRFYRGKLRRLALPGAVAITAFMLASDIAGTRFAIESEWWRPFFTPYAHFWFLQSILVIFFVYGSFDALTRGRFLIASLPVISAAYLVGLPVRWNIMSVHGALYLLPYFVSGMILSRHAAVFRARSRGLFILLLLIATATATVKMNELLGESPFYSRRDLSSLLFGLSMAGLFLLYLPRMRWLDGFGPLAFTIYLYHVFGTSLMRRILHLLGIENIGLHLLLGIAAGFALPWFIHVAAMQHPWGKGLVLGQFRRKFGT